MKTLFSSLLSFSVLFTLIVVVLGAYTRLSDAGLGCPDWPGCYGHLTVPQSLANPQQYERPLEHSKAWAEMIHRYAAGTLGILVLGIFLISLLFGRKIKQTAGLPFILLCTIIFQAALGMWTVTLKLHPLIVTGHLLGGFLTLSLLWWLWLKQHTHHNAYTYASYSYAKQLRRLRPWAFIALILVIGQITLGGWTSSNYAAVACGVQFPLCHGAWWPSMDMDFAQAFNIGYEANKSYEFGVLDNPARTTIHMLHRMGAGIVFIYLGLLVVKLLHGKKRFFTMLPYVLLALLLTQITLGILNVVLALPLGIATAHNLVAALLLLAIITLNQSLYRTH